MRAFTVSTIDYYSSYPPCIFLQSSIATSNPSCSASKFINLTAARSSPGYLLSHPRPGPHCFTASEESAVSDGFDDDADYFSISGDESDCLEGDGVIVEVKKLGKNWRRIRSKIGIDASLDDLWKILTDYEKLADFIPGLAVSKLIDKKGNFARLYQIGQQRLPLGMTFNAKAILDCYEKELEILAHGKRRDIEFKMTEGDFNVFEGKWSIEQLNSAASEDTGLSVRQECGTTTLSYWLDVKPKLWLPIHLVEGRLCKEIKTNLSCIRQEAQKMVGEALQSL